MSKQIKTFDDACAALKLKASILPDFSGYPEKHRKAMIAHSKLIIIAEALNEKWQPDWSNTDEYKYTPWFSIDVDKRQPSGFGLSYFDCDGWDAFTYAGSRLCFKTRELAKYAGEQFIDLYKEYMLIG